MAKHPVQQVAIGFVSLICFDSDANIIAAVERGVRALMDKSRQAAIEYSDQINILSGLIVQELAAHTACKLYACRLNLDCFLGLLPFLLAATQVYVSALKQGDLEAWQLRPFSLCHSPPL